jgi:hypothetical protein
MMYGVLVQTNSPAPAGAQRARFTVLGWLLRRSAAAAPPPAAAASKVQTGTAPRPDTRR